MQGAIKTPCIFSNQKINLQTKKIKNIMKITNIRTKEVITDFKSTPSNYLVKCDGSKYATHTDDAGNYYCMYGTYAAFDGKDIIILNNN